MSETKRTLKVFLCHASTDKPKIRELYRYLKRRGINPWFDEEHLVGGQDWQVEIPKALATSDAIIICLTKNSVDKEGYIQKEIKFALDKALEMPEGRIFLIPVKFEECEVPFSLSRYQWVDLTVEAGYAKMMKALKFHASHLERSKAEISKKDVEEENLAREKKEREVAERDSKAVVKKALAKIINNSFIALSSTLFKGVPFIKMLGIVGIVIVLFWLGSWTISKFSSLFSIAETKATMQQPTATAPFTKSPLPSTKIPESSKTPTKTHTPPSSTPVVFNPHPDTSDYIDTFGVPMRFVPAGNFIMGSDVGYDNDNQHLIHVVALDAFYIDKYEVTNVLYKACVDVGKCKAPRDFGTNTRTRYYENNVFDNFPVVSVDWAMAKAYCEWRGIVLPSEAQWEKAARGTKGSTYPWGEEFNCSKANFCVVTDPTRVGSYESDKSPYGLYDMAGNITEWTNSLYWPYPYDPTDGRENLSFDQPHVARGYSFDTFQAYLARISETKFSSYGFRCARDATP